MVGSQVASAAGGLYSAGKQKEADAANYRRQLEIREIEWDRTRSKYANDLVQYEEQIDENFMAASRGYAAEQGQLNDLFNQASVAFQNDFVKLMEARQFYGSGNTARRLGARNLAAFGRSQALQASNLVRAREGYARDVTSIRDRLRQANREAYSGVMYKPQPGFAPVKPNTDMTGDFLSFAGSMASAAGAGLEGYAENNDGRMPWDPKPKAPAKKSK